MSYHHLTLAERESILVLHSHQLSIRNIALRLKRSPCTISRKLHRLSGEYKACEAQRRGVNQYYRINTPTFDSKSICAFHYTRSRSRISSS